MSLFSKYPELAPLSMFVRMEEGDYQQKEPFADHLDAEVLFVFGIFELGRSFSKYMKAHKDLEVVFLVETLAELLFFIHKKLDKGFDSDRIHVIWKEEGADDNTFAQEIAARFPYEQVAFLQNGFDEKRFASLKRSFLRKMVLEASIHKELINYPKLCENLFANVHRLSQAFDIGQWKDAFKGVPAVIGGAGPSLDTYQDTLRAIGDKALIFAGGSTITALDRLGISPHFLFAIDPNQEEYERLRYSYQLTAPLIYGNRVQKDIFRFFPGGCGYLRTDTGGLFDAYADDHLGIKNDGILKHLSEEALSVTTIALMTAIYLGCNPIYFAGVDLSLKKDKRYSGDILSKWEGGVKSDPTQETRWMMEKDVIDQVSKAYPGTQFYDATGDGTTFKHVLVKRIDAKSMVRQPSLLLKRDNLMLKTKFPITSSQIIQMMEGVKKSLAMMNTLIEEYLAEQKVYTIFAFEIENNQAFKLFFEGMVFALQTPLVKKLRKEGKEYTQEQITKNVFSKVLAEGKKLSTLI